MFELSIFLKFSDYVVKLLEYRGKRDAAYFQEVVKPSFEAAKVVKDDLTAMFRAIEANIESGADYEEIAQLVNSARAAEKSTRDALRGVWRHLDHSDMTEFEHGIYQLLGGTHGHTSRTSLLICSMH